MLLDDDNDVLLDDDEVEEEIEGHVMGVMDDAVFDGKLELFVSKQIPSLILHLISVAWINNPLFFGH